MDDADKTAERDAIQSTAVKLERYRNLARISTDWFWETDEDFTIIYMSDSVERITGFSKDTYIGLSRYDLASEETKQTPEWKRHCEQVARREPIKNFEYKHVGANGHTVFLRVNAVPMFHDDGTFRGYLGSTTDISELVMANRALEDVNRQLVERSKELEAAKLEAEKLARTDPLTGLHNRRAFFEHAHTIDELANRHKQAYSVIMMDIDHFKSVNDTFGHDVGDRAIKFVAGSVVEIARSSDIAGRIGGEEFGLLLPQTLADSAVNVAERLRRSVASKTLDVPGERIGLTASFGVAQYRGDQDSFQQILNKADQALYEAKRGGRDRVVVLGE